MDNNNLKKLERLANALSDYKRAEKELEAAQAAFTLLNEVIEEGQAHVNRVGGRGLNKQVTVMGVHYDSLAAAVRGAGGTAGYQAVIKRIQDGIPVEPAVLVPTNCGDVMLMWETIQKRAAAVATVETTLQNVEEAKEATNAQ